MDKITHVRIQSAYCKTVATNMDLLVRQLQDLCTHRWRLHSHYPKLSAVEHTAPQWWSHFVCGKCEVAHSELNPTPLCGTCQEPMEPFEDDAQRDAALLAAKEKDKYVTQVFLFKCVPCEILLPLPARIDAKKK